MCEITACKSERKKKNSLRMNRESGSELSRTDCEPGRARQVPVGSSSICEGTKGTISSDYCYDKVLIIVISSIEHRRRDADPT